MTRKTLISGYEKYVHDSSDVLTSQFPDQTVYKFENNWGASIIYHRGSYGFEKGLVELAVISWYQNDKFLISYDTEITNDVIGDLNEKQAQDILERIKNIGG